MAKHTMRDNRDNKIGWRLLIIFGVIFGLWLLFMLVFGEFVDYADDPDNYWLFNLFN